MLTSDSTVGSVSSSSSLGGSVDLDVADHELVFFKTFNLHKKILIHLLLMLNNYRSIRLDVL